MDTFVTAKKVRGDEDQLLGGRTEPAQHALDEAGEGRRRDARSEDGFFESARHRDGLRPSEVEKPADDFAANQTLAGYLCEIHCAFER